MNEDQNQELFKVEQPKVSAVGKMDMSGAFGASSINVEKVKGAENFGKTVVRLIKYMRPELIALILMIYGGKYSVFQDGIYGYGIRGENLSYRRRSVLS